MNWRDLRMFHGGLMIKKLIGKARNGTRMVTKRMRHRQIRTKARVTRGETRVLDHVVMTYTRLSIIDNHPTFTFFTFRLNLRSNLRL